MTARLLTYREAAETNPDNPHTWRIVDGFGAWEIARPDQTTVKAFDTEAEAVAYMAAQRSPHPQGETP